MSALRHMLGLDADHRSPWRNYYVIGEGPNAEIDALVARGLVEQTRRPGFLDISDRVYMATAAGIAEALAENASLHPQRSRSKTRYLNWLNVADALGCSFGEYLKRRLYETHP